MAGGRGWESMAYDRAGNITALNRRASDGRTADSLAYSYTFRGAQLASVSDRSTNTSPTYMAAGISNYTYDANGNMKTRVNTANTLENITASIYNYLDLPRSLTAGGATVSYLYDGSGKKVMSSRGANGQTRAYMDGIEYANGTLELIHMEEGRLVRSGSGSYSYEYILKDHLGNARAGFRGMNGVATTANFGTDYYPFGLQYQSKIGQPSPKNNYLYNGKELQDRLKQYDYGARFYDPVIGRWGAVDPLAENHFNLTPYNYVMNNPMSYVDLFGLDTLNANNVTQDQWKNFNANKDVMAMSEITVTATRTSEGGTWDNSKLALEIGGGVYGAMEGLTSSQGQWVGTNGKYYNNSWGGNQYTGSRSGAFKAANQYKLAGKAVLGVSAVIGVAETFNGYQMDGGQFGYNTQSAAAQTVGSLAGGWVGAEAGATVGGAIGVWFGGVGVVPGAVIGGVVGGFVGGFYGGQAGGNFGQGIVNYYHGR